MLWDLLSVKSLTNLRLGKIFTDWLGMQMATCDGVLQVL
jgi:hypothetical protein